MGAPKMCLILSENWTMTSGRDLPSLVRWAREAEDAGFDSVMISEHIVLGPSAGASGVMPNPRGYALPGNQDPATPWPSSLVLLSAIAAVTERIRLVAGAVIAPLRHPLLIARELGSLDLLSGGRLVAGLPLGSPMDVNFCYGVTPMEHRERYREAFALTLKAWQAREIFAWNGRYYQLAEVNLWPRPIQQPHPPVWVPGSGSISTFDFAVDNEACYCFLSYSGAKAANSMMQRYWQVVSDKGREPNPYRAGFLQLVAVADTDAQAEAKYARHVEYFYQKCLHLPLHLLSPAGNQDYRSLLASLSNPVRRIDDMKSLRYGDFVERGYVIAGSPATVRDRRREEVVKELRVGNLMVLLQIGSMPHELALENIDLFARKVLPEFRDEWNDDGWVNYWWPEQLRDRVGKSVPVAVGGQ